MTDTPLSDDVVELAARAMLSASRPGVNPDDLTPAPRGQLGMVPKWKMYEHLARAALEAARYGDPVLPCDVQLPPATTITAGCKLSTLIHALELRGMRARP